MSNGGTDEPYLILTNADSSGNAGSHFYVTTGAPPTTVGGWGSESSFDTKLNFDFQTIYDANNITTKIDSPDSTIQTDTSGSFKENTIRTGQISYRHGIILFETLAKVPISKSCFTNTSFSK